MKTLLEFTAILGILPAAGMLIKNAIVLTDETDTKIADEFLAVRWGCSADARIGSNPMAG